MKRLVSILAALALLLTACAPTPNTAGDKPELRYGMPGAWDSLMPYDSASGSNYARLIYDKLYDRPAFIAADGTLKPRAARSWESADGGMAIVFSLDERAVFHDGTPVTARHWVDTVRLVTDPDSPVFGRGQFSVLAGTDGDGRATGETGLGAEAVDEYTLKLTFKRPTDPTDFLQERGRELYVLPTHMFGGVAAADVLSLDLWRAPIGSGPCKFVSELSGAQLILEAHEDYHLGAPAFGRMTVTVMDRSALLAALMAGDLDYYAVGNAVNADEGELAAANGLTVTAGESPTAFYELMLHNGRLDRDTRRAIAAALDRALLCLQNTGGHGTVTNSSIIGYRAGAPFAPSTPTGNGPFVLATTAPRADLAALIQSQLAAAGIAVQIEQVDSAALFAGMSSGVYDMGLASHTPGQTPLWFTESRLQENNNLFHIPDLTAYQRLVEAVRMGGDREVAVAALEDYLTSEMPFVPLWFSNALHVESPVLEGVDYESASFSNENVWAWRFRD